VNETIQLNLAEIEKKFYTNNERRLKEILDEFNARLPPENALDLMKSMGDKLDNIDYF
jgi:hypothetical protein